MTNIFLENNRIQNSLEEPNLESINHIDNVREILGYIRLKNYMLVRKGDQKLCRAINGQTANWVNEKTNASAELWICSPYPNLRHKDVQMEHVVGTIQSGEKNYIFDGTASQTNVSHNSILVRECSNISDDTIADLMGGSGWRPL